MMAGQQTLPPSLLSEQKWGSLRNVLREGGLLSQFLGDKVRVVKAVVFCRKIFLPDKGEIHEESQPSCLWIHLHESLRCSSHPATGGKRPRDHTFTY